MDREKDEPVSSLGNRMTLCAVAICLMWLTSLRCVVSLVGFFIPAPTESSVIEDCRTAYVRLDAEKTNHMTCADFQLDQCFKNLDSAVLQANDAIGATQRANSDLISNLSAANSVCTSVLTQSTNSLSSWSLLATQSPKNNVSVAVSGISYNIEYGSNGSTVLSEWEKNSCRALVHDVGSGSVDSLQSNSSAYALGSDGSVSRVVQYSIALNAYNQQYVQNKTSGLRSLSLEALDRVSVTSIDSALNSSLQTLKAELMMAIVCLSFNGTDGSCPLSGQRMVDVYQTYSAWISRYIDAFTIEVAQKSSAYVTAVEGALTVAQQFFDAVSGATGLIKYIKNSLPGVNLCGKSNPDWCQFSKSSLYISGIDMPSMSPGELQMPPVTYMWKKVEGMAHDILGMFSSSGVDLREQNLAFYRELHDAVTSVDFSTSDYHPPTYADFSHDGFNDPKEEASAQRNRTLEYQSSVTAIISGMNADAANIADMFRASFGTSFNATALFSSATTLPQVSSFSMPLHTSVFVRMESIAAWLAPLLSIRTLLFLFDYLYRIAQSIRLLTSYWNSSAAELPPVDLRVKGDGTLGRRLSKSDSWSQYLNNAATWFLLLASSWMYVVLFVVLVALILYVLAGVFMAEYSSYAGACVSHSTEQSHLSAFATQLAVFYASKPGHEAIVRGVAKYNVEVASVCSSQQQNASTHSLYSTQMRDFVSMNRTRHATLDNVDLLFRCVNMSDMDRQFTSHCDGESDSGSCNQCPVDPNTNHPFQTPSSYILNETRAVCYDDRVQQRLALSGTSIRELLPADAFKTVSIRPDAFNCTALPSCEVRSCIALSRTISIIMFVHCIYAAL